MAQNRTRKGNDEDNPKKMLQKPVAIKPSPIKNLGFDWSAIIPQQNLLIPYEKARVVVKIPNWALS
jgi:hypothetical protein